MSSSASVQTYIHIDGFDSFERDAFNRSKVRAGFRKAGRIVARRAQLNLALARGAQNYPLPRTGELVQSVNFRVSRAGFLVRVAPDKTAGMKDYYPAYLYYGVRAGGRVGRAAPGAGVGKSNRRRRGERAAALAARAGSGWRIAPRANYMADALQDESQRVRDVLTAAFAAALR